MFDDLNFSNVSMYEIKNYDNPHCTTEEEFLEDINRIKYIKVLFNRYKSKGVLRDRLILNHLIILFNVIEVHACVRILFLKIDEEYWEFLKPFLLYLNYLPTVVTGINGKDVITSDIRMNQGVIDILRKEMTDESI